METGCPYDIEHRIRRADGVYRWFMVRALPVRDAEGSIVRWYTLITDIDERKKTHERLQRSEAFLAQGQRISRTGSLRLASVADGEIHWSDELYSVLEYDQAIRSYAGAGVSADSSRRSRPRSAGSPRGGREKDGLRYRASFVDAGWPHQASPRHRPSGEYQRSRLCGRRPRTSPPPRRRKRRSAKAKRKPGNFSICRRCTSPNWGPTGHASTPIGRRWIITALLWRNGRTPICGSCCIRRTPKS